MTNWYEKFKNSMSEAIENGWDLRAVNTANSAHEFSRLGRITRAQAKEIQSMYDAWVATWDEESARTEAATREALAAAGMLAQEEAAAEEAPAVQPARKSYANDTTSECTTSAAEALRWHRQGDALTVYTLTGDTFARAVNIPGAPQENARQEDENRAHCKHIALELDAYVNGEVKRCPDCGEIHRRDWGDVGDAFKCPNCGEVASVDDWEWLGVHDFLADCFDVEYRVSGRARDALRSVRVMVACGGPNIYLDTASKDVELYWWTESARYPLSYEAAAALDEWAEEMWCCL